MRPISVLCLILSSLPFSLLLAKTPKAPKTHWVGTWGASPSPQLADTARMNAGHLSFANQTLREIVHVSIGGSEIRVRLSNAYGKTAVEIGAAHIALHGQGAAIVPGSDHVLTFGGRPTAKIPPNALVLSDPVALELPASADLAISLFLPKAALGAGIHYSSRQTNFVGVGDLTAVPDIPTAATIESWIFLNGIDVAAPASASTLIAFGDSITDGSGSTKDANHRWPNLLSERLLARRGSLPLGVLDEGIGGNRILFDPNSNIAFGVNALARFDRDVLAQPAAQYVIILEGINDLGHAGPNLFPEEQVSAEDIIAGLKQLAGRAHEKGLKVYGATLTPFAGVPFPGYFSSQKEEARKTVNAWIRNSSVFDGVVDFERAIDDPANPGHMGAAYDSGDHLHPNDNGYKAMADAVDLSLFK